MTYHTPQANLSNASIFTSIVTATLPLLPGLAMQSVESRVCNNWESGTKEDVKIRFKSTKSSSTCRTEVLDRAIGYMLTLPHLSSLLTNWGRNTSETWGYERYEEEGIRDDDHNYLGSCAKEFRPSDDLEFRVEIITDAPIDTIDDVEICHLRVRFGRKDQKGSSIWEWSRTDGPPGEGAWKKGCLTCKISVQISLRR